MKKIIIVLALLTTQVGFAQSGMEKLIQMALNRGADTNGICLIDNVKDKFIYEPDVIAYLQNRGCIILNSSSKRCFKFGNKEDVVDKVSFLNGKEGYEKYHHCNVRGTFYHPTPEPHYNRFAPLDFKKITSRMDTVPWSGKIVNGLLDGEGIATLGFVNGWCAIKCKFHCGIPVSKPEIIFSFPSNLDYASKFPFPRDYEKNKEELQLMLNRTYDATTDQTLRWAISENMKLYFEEEIRDKFEPEYEKALTLNSLKNMDYNAKIEFIKKFEIDKKIDELAEIKLNYEQLEKREGKIRKYVANDDKNLNYFLGWISKAKEIINVYNLARDYYDVVPPQGHKSFRRSIGIPSINYFKLIIGGGLRDFKGDRVRNCINNLNSVKDKIHDRQSPFCDFYNAIYPDIQAADHWINKELENALYKDYSKWFENLPDMGSLDSYQKYLDKMCDNCKINGKETTAPDGYEPEDDHWLWGHPARSKEKGIIVFQNGQTCEWEYIYFSDGRRIDVEGNYRGSYKNEKEMWDDLLAKCKERFCR